MREGSLIYDIHSKECLPTFRQANVWNAVGRFVLLSKLTVLYCNGLERCFSRHISQEDFETTTCRRLPFVGKLWFYLGSDLGLASNTYNSPRNHAINENGRDPYSDVRFLSPHPETCYVPGPSELSAAACSFSTADTASFSDWTAVSTGRPRAFRNPRFWV